MFDIDKARGHFLDGMIQGSVPLTREEDAYARISFPRHIGRVPLSDVRVQMRHENREDMSGIEREVHLRRIGPSMARDWVDQTRNVRSRFAPHQYRNLIIFALDHVNSRMVANLSFEQFSHALTLPAPTITLTPAQIAAAIAAAASQAGTSAAGMVLDDE